MVVILKYEVYVKIKEAHLVQLCLQREGLVGVELDEEHGLGVEARHGRRLVVEAAVLGNYNQRCREFSLLEPISNIKLFQSTIKYHEISRQCCEFHDVTEYHPCSDPMRSLMLLRSTQISGVRM